MAIISALMTLPALTTTAYGQSTTNAAYTQMANDIVCLETAGYWQTCTVNGWLQRTDDSNTATLFITGAPDEDGHTIILTPSQARALPVNQFVRVQAKDRNEDNRFVALTFYQI